MVLTTSFGSSALIPLKDLSRPASQDRGFGNVARAPADETTKIISSIAVQASKYDTLNTDIYEK